MQKTNVQYTVQLLTDEWVLRDHFVEKGGTHIPVMPLDSLTLVLFDDKNYNLIRPKHASVEWGKWQLSDDRSLISVQVTNLDDYSTLSAMLGRWRIRKLTSQQLILKPMAQAASILCLSGHCEKTAVKKIAYPTLVLNYRILVV